MNDQPPLTDNSLPASLTLSVIGTISSCYPDKFGIPRQPALAPSATATLNLKAPFDHPDAVRGLEKFSHLWLSFLFHRSPERWTPLVRPPRLGGNTRIGVFASRSTHRPNRLGLSLVELVDIDTESGVQLRLRAHDLVDGTPVVDIKPYLPWADHVEQARGGYAADTPTLLPVDFTRDAEQQLATHPEAEVLGSLIREVLAQDPRPAYRRLRKDERRYGVRLHDVDVRFHVESDEPQARVIVDALVPVAT
ncbi:tRNA (N6-threonylcarbamoyladenosine(37)-N6)-methyltransferase TrmO [Kushneria phosphatilytica]|uniref:tRNA (N6-threonylcarbamoyladenosine(37)-N6)-methyltransferase TrmO n=1 Tax=Kushneria phosphatilytica TaxID=657387 RepID=A0A1S1NY37_9GAMM|nr:tRNA (N6-threonylcarbamoyladenosine(37)-N6)-methyltransferase TrmO [Kushneria phosphatilytica]OHV13465.1 tRNA (N6-threonylcarbamoyladenosine(37)-N6)-methyltransferase TrmO [Kushneria phosphatilytica]QEL10528.1 tRNA (N6-threonylcarbamoyladenosine(37)-N6)-methyltransferase TrmO [Kushneria phosphatilytica]